MGSKQTQGLAQRRALLKASGMLAGSAALGWPSLAGAQGNSIKIGHLTPLTGFLGALGEYAIMGVKLATEEINAAGGVLGRQLDVMSEDSVNPQVAASKAKRMIEGDKVAMLMGEINSASALTISQVAARHHMLYMNTGARSDALRSKDCNRYTFHVDIPVTVMVNAVGLALVRDHMVQGKRIYSLTADYLFGHDLAAAAKKFFSTHGGNQIGDELVATDVTDFSPYLLKLRQAKPDLIATNLAGNQVTNFVKQYAEYGLPYPVVGFNLNTADAWAAGRGNLSGIWPTVWYAGIKTPSAEAFTAAFTKNYGKPPENHAWVEYVTLKILAQAMAATQSTDTPKLVTYLESGAQFDILKDRKGYFRSWDHQMMQEAYPFTVKPANVPAGKWDWLQFGAPVPGPNQPLELLAPTRAESMCKMETL